MVLVRITAMYLIGLLGLANTTTFASSNLVQIEMYHGADGESRIIRVIDADETYEGSKDINLTLKEGSKVEFKVVNPNCLFYKYSLEKSELVVKEDSLDLSGFDDVLSALSVALAPLSNSFIPVENLDVNLKIDDPSSRDSLLDDLSAVAAYSTLLKSTTDEASAFLVQLKMSDAPLPFDQIKSNPGSSQLRAVLGGLPQNWQGFLRDDGLQTRKIELKALRDAADSVASNSNYLKVVVAGLVTAEKMLIKELERLNAMYKFGKDCKVLFNATVGEKPISYRIKAVPGNSDTKLRQTGDSLIVVNIYPEEQWDLIDVGTFALFAFTSSDDIKEFSLQDGIVRENDADPQRLGAGPMLLINFAETNGIIFSAGVGADISRGVENSHKNLLGALVLSVNENVRLGFGVGMSQYPVGLDHPDAKANEALPEDISDLDDIILYRSRLSGYLTLVLPFDF